MGNQPNVAVCFASYNTAAVTELCIRSMRATAGYPFTLIVGDCDSTDGSIEMLQRYAAAGQCVLDIARGGRRHGEWLDMWRRDVDADYIVFCDSDVEFLRHGWLATMVATAQHNQAALVATRIQARGGVAYVHPATGAVATLAARPEPWLVLYDLAAIRNLPTSFLYEERAQSDGTKIAYDTGAALFRDIEAAGLVVVELPADFARTFRHYSGMTWQKGSMPLRRRLKQFAKHVAVRVRLARSRVAHRNSSRVVA